jgi:hypothetical protein
MEKRMYRLGQICKKTLPFFALLAMVCVAACGLKVWPQPQAAEDTFAWGNIAFTAQGTCLEIHGVLTGAYENLAKIELEIAYTDADCPTCPFQSEQSVIFNMDAPELSRHDGTVRIKYCQLPVSATYRWRVIAYNVHPLLKKVQSKVFFATE